MALRTRIYTGEFWESSGTSLKFKLTAKRQNFDRIDRNYWIFISLISKKILRKKNCIFEK